MAFLRINKLGALNGAIKNETMVKKKRTKKATVNSAVKTVKVNPMIWKMIKDIDKDRIEIISANEVLIHNNGNWRKPTLSIVRKAA